MINNPKAVYTVYVLQNTVGKVYVGLTANLNHRISQHRKGRCPASSKLGCTNFKLLRTYSGLTYIDASRLERLLHTYSDNLVTEVARYYSNLSGKLSNLALYLEPTEYELKRMAA